MKKRFSDLSPDELRAYNREAQIRSRNRKIYGSSVVPLLPNYNRKPGDMVEKKVKKKIVGNGSNSCPIPTDEMISAANARASASRNITQFLMGDPPQGYSALDGHTGMTVSLRDSLK